MSCESMKVVSFKLGVAAFAELGTWDLHPALAVPWALRTGLRKGSLSSGSKHTSSLEPYIQPDKL